MARSASTAVASDRSARRDGAPPTLDLTPVAPLLARLEAALHPVAIWLFGSRARGDAKASSDWDLFVVVPSDVDDAALGPHVGGDLARAAAVSADVVLCRADDFEDARDVCNTLAYEVAHTGVVIRGG
jgi:uncharacterized protein